MGDVQRDQRAAEQPDADDEPRAKRPLELEQEPGPVDPLCLVVSNLDHLAPPVALDAASPPVEETGL